MPWLRHSWSRIDAVAILGFWVAFGLAEAGVERGNSHVGVFRALSVLRTARLLTVTSGTTVSFIFLFFSWGRGEGADGMLMGLGIGIVDDHAFVEDCKAAVDECGVFRVIRYGPILVRLLPSFSPSLTLFLTSSHLTPPAPSLHLP